MNIFILKLILAPLIIGSASLAGRKWGPAVSGWIVGMPLTSGPVVFFVALDHGVGFAASSILGVLSGGISLVVYSVTFAWLATRFRWYVALLGSFLFLAITTLFMQSHIFPFVVIAPAVTLAAFFGLKFMPKGDVEPGETQLNRWDIPMRVLIGTSFILLLTGVAPFIGSRLTGLLAMIPLYVSILAVFAHRNHGPAAAAHVQRGLLYGMFAYIGFFIVLNLLIERTSLGVSHCYEGIIGVDLETGKQNWHIDPFGRDDQRSLVSPIIAGDLVIAGSGAAGGTRHIVAVSLEQSGSTTAAAEAYHITRQAPHIPTPLAYGPWLFLWSDQGIATCLDRATGKIVWQQRIGGNFYSSPICVDGRIYCIDLDGVMVVIAAADKYEELSRVTLGHPTSATPAVSDGIMFIRTESHVFSLGGAK